MDNLESKRMQNSTTIFSDNDFNNLYEMSEGILKSTSINRLFYSICKFFCSYFSCSNAQGFVCINEEFYLVSDFKTSVNHFTFIDYIPCQVVNADLYSAKDYIITTFKSSTNHLKGGAGFLNQFPSLHNNTFMPLFCDDFFYGFILLDGEPLISNTSNLASRCSNLINLQSSACIKNLCNNTVNLYFSLPLNICHPIFASKLNELEHFTILISMDGTILNCSNGSIDVLKYSSSDLINASIYKYIHPDYRNKFVSQCKSLLKNKRTYTGSVLMINKLRTYSLVKYTLKCSYDEIDNVNGIITLISRLDYSDEAIQKEFPTTYGTNIIYNTNNIFSSATNGLFIIKDKKLVYVNDIAMGYFGLGSNTPYTGKSLEHYLSRMTMDEIKLNKHKSITSTIEEMYDKHVSNVDITLMRSFDNSILNFNLCVSPISNELLKNSIVVLIKCTSLNTDSDSLKKDIATKNELLNCALKNDKMRCDFFTNISHDLRTPVNVIYSALQLLDIELPKYINDIKSTPIVKRTNIIRQNCYRLIKLVNNVIDSSKIESGYIQVVLINVDIIALVENITNSVSEYIENKNIKLVFDTNTEEKKILCDPEKIERIMLNLISNAVKFTPENGYIYVNMEDKRTHIIISVRDTGLGIPPEKLNIIFERFSQVNSNRFEEKQGSGIGLSLVKSLVEIHKGTVWAESTENVGTTFFIKLPYFDTTNSHGDNGALQDKVMEKGKVQNIEIEFSDIY